jgi:hypothetical protein
VDQMHRSAHRRHHRRPTRRRDPGCHVLGCPAALHTDERNRPNACVRGPPTLTATDSAHATDSREILTCGS